MPADYRHIAFGGSGARLPIFVGVYQALEEAGLLKKIEAISGSSGGSIAALFSAIGIGSKKSWELLTKQNLFDMLGKKESRWKIGKRDGAPLLEFLKEQIKQQIKNFLEEKNKEGRSVGNFFLIFA